MKSCTYRLSDDTIDQLKFIAERENMNQTEAVRSSIDFLFNSLVADEDETPADYVPRSIYDDTQKVVDNLTNQLVTKDNQIEALNQALLNAQESIQAAQALHAVDRKEDFILESQEQKKSRKSWWRKLFE